jgi:hypothetical protein
LTSLLDTNVPQSLRLPEYPAPLELANIAIGTQAASVRTQTTTAAMERRVVFMATSERRHVALWQQAMARSVKSLKYDRFR